MCSILSAHRSHVFEFMPFLRPVSEPIVITYLNILLLHRLDYLHCSARQALNLLDDYHGASVSRLSIIEIGIFLDLF